ncbi:Histone chaperone asf1 [Malassezia japonica]|uniref:Anti-silencing function protein 1 n=1 Tax=Malassezia japonica TaxID=223818 RepID=A0AAF0JC79_9BASI|nr:Histone chaperone asf1 [Malassezia japonica]WFD41263.1 Histone chaperone asf1 [Malassezia japonica]
MSIVHLQNVEIINSKARFSDPYIFKVTFECISPLEDDIEWKLIYVGSAESEEYDQELDSCMVGPVPVGVNSFEFEAEAPSPEKIPATDLLGVTVILLTASYKDAEFIRVGYYVNNAYESEEMREDPPEEVQLDKVCREVLASKPRVTRFNINWSDPSQPIKAPEEAQEANAQTTEVEETVETTPNPSISADTAADVAASSFVPLAS